MELAMVASLSRIPSADSCLARRCGRTATRVSFEYNSAYDCSDVDPN